MENVCYALQRHRREHEGVRRVGLGGRDLSASGYPLVLKNGLEIFVSVLFVLSFSKEH